MTNVSLFGVLLVFNSIAFREGCLTVDWENCFAVFLQIFDPSLAFNHVFIPEKQDCVFMAEGFQGICGPRQL